ncbi:MAG TPA: GAF domain-containing protein [Candidatus Thermoplasmatota archaeon]
MPQTGDTLEAQLQRYQRRFRVLRGVLLATRRQGTSDDALAAFIAAVCNGFGWPGGCYFANDGGSNGSFTPTRIRFPENGSQQNIWRALAERSREELAKSFDAAIVRDEAPRWIPNVTLEPTFEATKQAVALGVRGLVAVPVIAGGRLYGIVEFFTREEFNPSSDQVEYLADLGQVVGAAVHFREVDRRIRKVRRDQDLIFARLRDPVYVVDRNGRATFANESAAALFGVPAAEELVGEDIHTRFHVGADGVAAVPASECPLHGVPARSLDGARRRERFRTEAGLNVDVEAVAAPIVIAGTEETVIVLRVP